MTDVFLPLLVFFALAAFIGVVIMVLSAALSRKNATPIKLMPYECGMDPIGGSRSRFSVRFFLIAMLFILFGVELVFMFAWAPIFRELQIFGFVEMLVFVLVLFAGLIYVWKKGALEWE